jgi:hypothetical protein
MEDCQRGQPSAISDQPSGKSLAPSPDFISDAAHPLRNLPGTKSKVWELTRNQSERDLPDG